MSNAPGGFTRIRPRSEIEYEEGSRKNIEATERIVSCVVGIVMVCGILQLSLAGFLTAMIGAWLVYRGSTGHCPICSLIATKTVDEDDEDGSESTREPEAEESLVSPRLPVTLSRRHTKPPVAGGEDRHEREGLPRKRQPRFKTDADAAPSVRRGGGTDFER